MSKKLVVFTIVFLIGIVVFINLQSSQKVAGMNEEMSLEQYQEKLENKDSFIAYVYSPQCPTCQRNSPIINSVVEETGITIYSLNIDNADNYDDEFFERENLFVVPTIIQYNTGKEEERKTESYRRRN